MFPISFDLPESLFEKSQKDHSEELSDVKAASGQSGVDFVDFLAIEMLLLLNHLIGRVRYSFNFFCDILR